MKNLAILAFLFLSGLQDAHSCGVVSRSIEQKVKESDLILVGYVEKAERLKKKIKNIDSFITLRVQELLKSSENGPKIGDLFKVYYVSIQTRERTNCPADEVEQPLGTFKTKVPRFFYLRKIGGRFVMTSDFRGGLLAMPLTIRSSRKLGAFLPNRISMEKYFLALEIGFFISFSCRAEACQIMAKPVAERFEKSTLIIVGKILNQKSSRST